MYICPSVIYPVRSGVGWVISGQIKKLKIELRNITWMHDMRPSTCNKKQALPSFGIVKIGIWVIEPFRPSILPARS